MTTYNIENKLEDAFVAYLQGSDDITASYVVNWADGSQSETTPAVVVHAELVESMVAGGFQNSVAIEVMCMTHSDDDKSGAVCDGLVSAVRDKLRDGSAVSLVNAEADGVTVIGLNPESDAYSDEIDRRRVQSVTCEVIATNP